MDVVLWVVIHPEDSGMAQDWGHKFGPPQSRSRGHDPPGLFHNLRIPIRLRGSHRLLVDRRIGVRAEETAYVRRYKVPAFFHRLLGYLERLRHQHTRLLGRSN